MPSLYEGFGLVVLEAASYNVPTIAYGASGMSDIISDGVNGFIVKRNDWRKMADVTSDLLDNPEKLKIIQSEAKALLDRYSKEKVITQWSELLSAICSNDELFKNDYFVSQNSLKSKNWSIQDVLEEYENTIYALQNETGNPQVSAYYEYYEEYMRIQSSLSWKIIKHLRIIKKRIVVLCNTGVIRPISVMLLKLRRWL